MEIFNRSLDPSTPFFFIQSILIINKLFLTLREYRVGSESDYHERERKVSVTFRELGPKFSPA